jgi:hypothetical protein
MVVQRSPKLWPRPGRALGLLLAALVVALSATVAVADPVVIRQGVGTSAADIQGAVDQFRNDLGARNPNQPGSFGSGRREIAWDGTPDAASSPNNMPADFFNTTVRAGTVFSTPGTGFQVSGRPGTAPIDFDNINPGYSAIFQAFSSPRLFTAVGSNVTTVHFFVAGTSEPALVRGFGSVFSNVQLPDTTKIDAFDINGNLIATAFAPASAAAGNLSFVGLSFANPIIASVRITTGNAALGPGVNNGNGVNLVVMDDFIFGEPVPIPEPSTLALLLTGGAALGGWLRRRRGGAESSNEA